MSKKVLGIILIIILAIAGGGTYLVLNAEPNGSETQDNATTHPTSNPADQKQDSYPEAEQLQASGNAELGAYKDYDSSIVAATAGTKLLFFHAPWCPQCRELESDIKSKGVPSGVTIFKVDYDSNQSLRQKYGVTLQTTIVEIDDEGNLVKKFVAYDDPSVSAIKENLL